MPQVAAPIIDWSGGTGAQSAAEPVSPISGVVIVPSAYAPVSTADNNLCPVGGGSDTYAYPIGA